MILYFSGTGNSKYVAEKIAEKTKDELISINNLLKNNEIGNFNSSKPYIFVCPTYSWAMPKIVEEFILNSVFNGNKDVYFILTCGGGTHSANLRIKKMCKNKNFNFKGFYELLMPENYTVLSMIRLPNKKEAINIINNAKPKIDTISNYINSNKSFPDFKSTGKIYTYPVNYLFYKFVIKGKHFYNTNKCIRCGKCVKNCPLNNIKMEEKFISWGNNCTHCMACINRCPTKAIEYKNSTKGRFRYYLPDVLK